MQTTFVSTSYGVVSSETVDGIIGRARMLGQGASRKVYDLGNAVLKVSEYSTFAGDCTVEAQTWEQIKGTSVQEHFAAVLAYDGCEESERTWLVMEKADATVGWTDDYYSWSGSVGNVLSDLGFNDLHGGNIGYFGGQIKVIDYAYMLTDEVTIPSNLAISACTYDGARSGSSDPDATCHCDDCEHARVSDCTYDGCTFHHGACDEGACEVCYPRGTCDHRSKRFSFGHVYDTCLGSMTYGKSACRKHRPNSLHGMSQPFGEAQGLFVQVNRDYAGGPTIPERFTIAAGLPRWAGGWPKRMGR